MCMLALRFAVSLFEMYYRRGEGKRPHLEATVLLLASACQCRWTMLPPKALLARSGVQPEEVLFVDDNEDNIRSVRRRS